MIAQSPEGLSYPVLALGRVGVVEAYVAIHSGLKVPPGWQRTGKESTHG